MALLYPSTAALELAALVNAGLADCIIGLYGNEITLSAATTFDDLVEATFSGYARKTLADGFSEPYFPAGGSGAEVRSGEQAFVYVAPTPPTLPVTNTIFGFFVLLADESLFVVGDFADAVPMVMVGDSAFVNVILGFGANG